MNSSQNQNSQVRIAIQGIAGSNHHKVLVNSWEEDSFQILPKQDFRSVFKSLQSGEANLGLIAIENTIAGSILGNFDLLSEYKPMVVGEVYLHIQHDLIGLPRANLKDIRYVYSHEMALKQCLVFLQKHNLHAREYHDTAAAVEYIVGKGDKSAAALAPAIAADIYGGEILQAAVETDKQNFTRFIYLSAGETLSTSVSKTSTTDRDNDHWQANLSNQLVTNSTGSLKTMLELKLPHKPGSLVQLLQKFADANLNLTKIQSRPVVGEPWNYIFYLDFVSEGLNAKPEIQEFLQKLEKDTSYLQVHGIFLAGKTT